MATAGDNVVVFTDAFHDIAHGGPTVRQLTHVTVVDGELQVLIDRPTITGC